MNLKLLKVARFFHLIKKEKYKEKRQIGIVRHSPFFDEQWYLEQYPDVRASGMTAAEHYVKFGWKEGRNPGPDFDTNDYLREYPDVKKSNMNPIYHYALFGKNENRKTFATQSDVKFKTIKPNLLDKIISYKKNKNPLISIIVASYNYQNYIRETLDSLVNQTYKNFEVIVVDDGSVDNSVDIIKSYVKKYSNIYLYQHHNNTNRGLTETIKLGLKKAKGEYVAFCESDDMWESDYLEQKVKIIREYANPVIIVNDVHLFGDRNRCLLTNKNMNIRRIKLNKTINRLSISDFRDKNWIATFSSCMVKKSELLKCDFNHNNRPSAIDWWLWKQICAFNKIYFINNKLTLWRMHSSYNTKTSKCFILNQKRFLELSDQIILKKHPIRACFLLFRILKSNLLKQSNKNKISRKNYNIIKKSNFFDKNWYLAQNIDVAEEGVDPIKHYLMFGWKEGRNTGPDFDGNLYLKTYPDVNNANFCPLLHYELHGKYEKRNIFKVQNKVINAALNETGKICEASEEDIAKYWKGYKKNKKVLYTCIIGDYDKLINHKFIAHDYDYICFTDNKDLLKQKTWGVWQIHPLAFTKLDNTRNNRWHKVHPHILFKEYVESIYIDGNINILTSYIFDFLKTIDKTFILPAHFSNTCIYSELDFIVKCNKDSLENIEKVRNFYKNERFPHNLGLGENNFLYRKHKDKRIIKIMELWWNMITNFSKRDQASLVYAMWKNKFDIRPCLIKNLRLDKDNFAVYSHIREMNAFTSTCVEKYKKEIDMHKVISFDIFDTLLVRPYVKPSDLFYHLERIENSIGFADARKKAEYKARKCHPTEKDITIDMIYENIDQKYLKIKNKELALEEQILQPHPIIKQLYEYAIDAKKMVLISSDMYLSKDFLTNLLKKKGYADFDKIYISCEENASKRDGSLYEKIIKEINVPVNEILHIGDNITVDCKNAEEFGIHTLYIPKMIDNLYNINLKAKNLAERMEGDIGTSIFLGCLALHSYIYKDYCNKIDYFKLLGYEYAGAFCFQFIKWVYDDLIKKDVKDVIMVARDGYTFQKVFNLFNSTKINSHYVYAPRFVSLLISLNFDRNNQEQVASIANYYRTKIDSTSKNINNNNSYQDNLNFIDENWSEIQKYAILKKKEYLSYLEQFNFVDSKLAIVDIATIWFTSQKLFEYIYPEKKISGYYWRINSRNKPLREENIFDKEGVSLGLLSPWDIMEVLFSSSEPPIQDLQQGKPIYQCVENDYEKEREINYDFISNGCVEFSADVIKIFKNIPTYFTPLMVANWINILKIFPNDLDKKFFYNIYHASDVSHKNYKKLFNFWYKEKAN